MTNKLKTFKIKMVKYRELMREAREQEKTIIPFLCRWHESLYPDDMSMSEDEGDYCMSEDEGDYWKCSDLWHEVNFDLEIGKLTKFLDE